MVYYRIQKQIETYGLKFYTMDARWWTLVRSCLWFFVFPEEIFAIYDSLNYEPNTFLKASTASLLQIAEQNV